MVTVAFKPRYVGPEGQRPGDRRIFQSIGRLPVGGGVVHIHRRVEVLSALHGDARLPGVLGDGETGGRELDHAGGVERRSEGHGEEGSESKGGLEFHGIDLISMELAKWRGRNAP